jgi:uncharacterized repeat protein (TIGR03803 family)
VKKANRNHQSQEDVTTMKADKIRTGRIPMHNRIAFLGRYLWMSRTGLTLATTLLFAVVAIRTAQAQTYSVLYSFKGKPDGSGSVAGLVRDGIGNLYGTTAGGGNIGFGTVFKLDKTGKETVLYNWGSYGNLVQDSTGTLYGTTVNGGVHTQGSVFKIDKTGKETDIYDFTGTGGDGSGPKAGLVRDLNGNLYGTTQLGGNLTCLSGTGCGTVFEVDGTGKETILYKFTGTGGDGANPVAAVLRDAKGNLYGTTPSGGNVSCEFLSGCGTVFRVDKTGHETVVYNFRGYLGGGDGAEPVAGLVRDAAGRLYGTTVYGGGSVFEIVGLDKETRLYSFCSGTGCPNGGTPTGGLLRDAAGNLYGTTESGGTSYYGTVFKLDSSGQETVLYNFTGGADGGYPEGNLIMDKLGNLYGTTYLGGDLACGSGSGCGVVFKLTP